MQRKCRFKLTTKGINKRKTMPQIPRRTLIASLSFKRGPTRIAIKQAVIGIHLSLRRLPAFLAPTSLFPCCVRIGSSRRVLQKLALHSPLIRHRHHIHRRYMSILRRQSPFNLFLMECALHFTSPIKQQRDGYDTADAQQSEDERDQQELRGIKSVHQSTR